jgi:hypothetical protein
LRYFCVRIVDEQVLSKYPPEFPTEVKQKGALHVIPCNRSDVATLNEINSFHLNYMYGRNPFSEKDNLVTYDDFMEFYNLLNTSMKKQQQQLASKSDFQMKKQMNSTINGLIEPPKQPQSVPKLPQQPEPQMKRQINGLVQQQQDNHIIQDNTRQQMIVNNNNFHPIQRPKLPLNIEFNPHNLRPEIVNRSTPTNIVNIHHIYPQRPPVFMHSQNADQQIIRVVSNKSPMIINQLMQQHNNIPINNNQQMFMNSNQPYLYQQPYLIQQNHLYQQQIHHHHHIRMNQFNTNHIIQTSLHVNNMESNQPLHLPPQLPPNLPPQLPPNLPLPHLPPQPLPQLPPQPLPPPQLLLPLPQPINTEDNTSNNNRSSIENQSENQNIVNNSATVQNINNQNKSSKEHEDYVGEDDDDDDDDESEKEDVEEKKNDSNEIENKKNKKTPYNRHKPKRTKKRAFVEQSSSSDDQNIVKKVNNNINETINTAVVTSLEKKEPLRKTPSPLPPLIDRQTNEENNNINTESIIQQQPVNNDSIVKENKYFESSKVLETKEKEKSSNPTTINNDDVDDDVIIIQESTPMTGGWLQLNDLILPYVDLNDKIYKFTDKFVQSRKYVPLEPLIRKNVIKNDNNLTMITNALREHVDFLNKLVSTSISDVHTEEFNLKTKLVNILEVIYEGDKLLFLKKLPKDSPKLNVNKDYLNVISLLGGLLVLNKSIIPFVLVKIENSYKKIVPFGCMKIHLDRYSETRDRLKFTTSTLEMERYKEFYELILFIVGIEQDLKKHSILLDITKLCEKYPNDFKILCEYTEKFPIDWKCSIKKLIKAQTQSTVNQTNKNTTTSVTCKTSTIESRDSPLNSETTSIDGKTKSNSSGNITTHSPSTSKSSNNKEISPKIAEIQELSNSKVSISDSSSKGSNLQPRVLKPAPLNESQGSLKPVPGNENKASESTNNLTNSNHVQIASSSSNASSSVVINMSPEHESTLSKENKQIKPSKINQGVKLFRLPKRKSSSPTQHIESSSTETLNKNDINQLIDQKRNDSSKSLSPPTLLPIALKSSNLVVSQEPPQLISINDLKRSKMSKNNVSTSPNKQSVDIEKSLITESTDSTIIRENTQIDSQQPVNHEDSNLCKDDKMKEMQINDIISEINQITSDTEITTNNSHFHTAICEIVKQRYRKTTKNILTENQNPVRSNSEVGSSVHSDTSESSIGKETVLKSMSSNSLKFRKLASKNNLKRKQSDASRLDQEYSFGNRRRDVRSDSISSNSTNSSDLKTNRKKRRIIENSDKKDFDEDSNNSNKSVFRFFNEFSNSDADSVSYNLRQNSGKLKPKHKLNPFLNSTDKNYYTQVTSSFDNDVFTSEREFNEEFFIKKYKIIPCSVSIRILDS